MQLSQQYPLHLLAFRNDSSGLENLLKSKHVHDINEKDHRGNTPLQIAVQLAHERVVDVLLKAGADPTIKNALGWDCKEEAAHSRNKSLIMKILEADDRDTFQKFQRKTPQLMKYLETLPDYYMEMHWSFRSIIPFVGRLAPSDTVKIHKRGSSIRIDLTLINIGARLTQERGDVSLMLQGHDTEHPGELFIVDHSTREYAHAFAGFANPSIERLEKIAERMMVQSTWQIDINSREAVAEPVTGWLRGEKREKIGKFNCKPYSVKNIKFAATRRPQEKKPQTLAEEEYFGGTDVGVSVWRTAVRVKETKKEVSPTVSMCEQHPLQIAALLPLVELVAPTARHFENLRTFLEMKLPAGFPVKLDIPLIPAILGAVVTMAVCDVVEVSQNHVTLPKGYILKHFGELVVVKKQREAEKHRDAIRAIAESSDNEDDSPQEDDETVGKTIAQLVKRVVRPDTDAAAAAAADAPDTAATAVPITTGVR